MRSKKHQTLSQNNLEPSMKPDLSLRQQIQQILQEKLRRHTIQAEPLTLDELLKIKAATDKDQPVALVFLLVINKELAFLQETITDKTEYCIISTFLQNFQQAVETDMLTMMSTLKDGLMLQSPVPPLAE